MLKFDDKFFEDEIRDGYFVRSEMKRRWAAEMEVLAEIDRVCKKNGIRYFADCGTLLGAVRHNGFVPWDDDMDIAMFRSDYMRFLSIVKEELLPPFMGINMYHYADFDRAFMSVQNGLGLNLNEDFLHRFHGCPYGSGVDIFCLDNMWESEEEFYNIIELTDFVSLVNKIVDMRREEKEFGKLQEDNEHWLRIKKASDVFSTEDLLLKVESMCNLKINREKNIKNQLFRILDGAYSLCDNETSEFVVDMAFATGFEYRRAGLKREWYREAVELPFENITIPVPIEYHKVLEQLYGIGYLWPVQYSHSADDHMRERMQEARDIIKDGKKRIEKLEKILGAY